ncbi:MAG: hypothetical protein AcusKO_05560 [Acuticoccus sp.]
MRVMLTVSPVPLMTTALPRHVLTSTVHSKSMLRVAAQNLVNRDDLVDYFPSYEVVTAPHTRAGAISDPTRAPSPAEEGVTHVMRLFSSSIMAAMDEAPQGAATPDANAAYRAEMQALAEAFCDEEALDDPRPVTRGR